LLPAPCLDQGKAQNVILSESCALERRVTAGERCLLLSVEDGQLLEREKDDVVEVTVQAGGGLDSS